ncbi:MAG: substrate-binding domain-containing protein, partial [Thermoplasmata archaeon]
PALTRVEHESQAASLVSTGTVCAVITYHSFAVANGMSYVPFNSTVGLNETSSFGLSQYASLTTQIIVSTGSLTSVKAAPVLFGVTIPSNAPNPELGAAFVHLLLSPLGSSIIAKGGAFQPIFPGWTNAPSAVPSVLAPDIAPMPAWVSGYLAPT